MGGADGKRRSATPPIIFNADPGHECPGYLRAVAPRRKPAGDQPFPSTSCHLPQKTQFTFFSIRLPKIIEPHSACRGGCFSVAVTAQRIFFPPFARLCHRLPWA